MDGLNDILERKDGSIAEICELKTLIKEGRERQNKLEREWNAPSWRNRVTSYSCKYIYSCVLSSCLPTFCCTTTTYNTLQVRVAQFAWDDTFVEIMPLQKRYLFRGLQDLHSIMAAKWWSCFVNILYCRRKATTSPRSHAVSGGGSLILWHDFHWYFGQIDSERVKTVTFAIQLPVGITHGWLKSGVKGHDLQRRFPSSQ